MTLSQKNIPIARAIKSGDWHTPAIWEAGRIPTIGENVVLGAGVRLVAKGTVCFYEALASEEGAVLVFDGAYVRTRHSVEAA